MMASRSAKQTRYAPPTTVSSAPKMNPRTSLASSIAGAVANRKPKATTGVARGITQQVMVDRNGNRSQRATLGPADPATRRAALNAALQPGPAVKPAPRPVKTTQPVDTSGAGGRARSRKIDDLVTKMQ
jgi:hypothetical protein